MDTTHSLRRNVKRSLGVYWRIAGTELIGYILFAIGQVTMVLTQTWFGGRIINDLVHLVSGRTVSNERVIFNMAILIASGILEQICWAMLNYLERRAYHKWSRHNYFTFLGKTSALSLGQFEDKELRQKLNVLIQEGYAWKPANFAQEVLYLFHTGLRMISTFVILASFLPLLIPILLLASVPTLLVEKRSAAIHWGIWGAKGDQSQTFWSISYLLQQRDSVLEITPQGSRNFLLAKADAAISSFFKAQIHALRRFLALILATRLFEGLVVGGISIWLVAKVIRTHGAFSIGQYSIYASVVQQFQSSTSSAYKNIVSLFDFNNFMNIYFDFLDSESALVMPENPIKIPANAPVTIEFKDVGFSYAGADKPVIQHLNLTIRPGDHLALVGENGAGKSTLIKLLLRFYDVTSGQILINGTDIQHIDLDSWYHHLGALFQTFNRYPLTLDDNIHIGRSDKPATRGTISRAMKLAGIENFGKQLRYGIETMLEPSFTKGTELSGGQWQKVALARAFYRDADVLILDEPTSAVDAKAEYDIFEQIHKTQAHKTTIIVSHRFSTVRQASRILVLENGTIKEDGTHEELVKHDGLYKEMFDKQAVGYR